jgi:O-antigen/teichoic acid export membrane protein
MVERTGRSALSVGAGAAIAALSGVLVLAIAARSLTTAQNSGFLTYWAALFAVFAVLSGIQNEMTRAVRADQRTDGTRGTSPIATALLVGVGAAVIVLLLFPLWQTAFRALDDRLTPMLLIAGAALLYAGHVATVGMLAGLGRWRAFGALTAAESLVRLVATAVVALVGAGTAGFEYAAAGGTLTWLAATLLLPRGRALWRARIALSRGALVRRVLNAMASSGANALLVTGFPLLMSVTTDPDVYSRAAPLVVAVSMTRAPLLIPITAFQSMVIAAFVEHPERARSSLIRLVAAISGIAAAGGVLAALVGPWLMRLVFGPAYGNTPLVLGLLVMAASLLALLVLGGSVALALDAHTVSAFGWYAALVVSVVIMLVPAPLEVRTVLALSLGPLVGSAIHLFFITRTLRRRAARVL